MEESQRFSRADSKYIRFIMAIKGLTSSGMPQEIATKAMEIMTGKTSMEGFPVCAPWSEEAKTQATQFVWLNYYSLTPFFHGHQDVETPFEKMIREF